MMFYLAPHNREGLRAGWYILVQGTYYRCKNKSSARQLAEDLAKDSK